MPKKINDDLRSIGSLVKGRRSKGVGFNKVTDDLIQQPFKGVDARIIV